MEFLHPAMWHDHDIDFARLVHPAVWHVAVESWQWIYQVAAPWNVIHGSRMTCHWYHYSVLLTCKVYWTFWLSKGLMTKWRGSRVKVSTNARFDIWNNNNMLIYSLSTPQVLFWTVSHCGSVCLSLQIFLFISLSAAEIQYRRCNSLTQLKWQKLKISYLTHCKHVSTHLSKL